MDQEIDWEAIIEELSYSYVSITFELDGHTIYVQKQSAGMLKSVLTVYVDGYIKGAWDPENMPIITKVWCKRTIAMYRKKEKEDIIKRLGKREAHKRFVLDKKIVYFSPIFSSADRFIRQYKKLEGLKRVK